MNPFTFIIDDYYGDTTARFGLAAAAVLLLRVLADHYAGDMPAGTNCYRWVLDQLDQYGHDNDFLKSLRTSWHGKANPHL